MNHERVNLLLDTKTAAELTAAERQAVDQHLASCSECREIWEAYDELAALRIPATPPYLRVRIATALAARASSHARRGLFIGVALLVGAALAATAVLQLTHRSSDSAPDPVPTIEEVVPAVEPVVPPEPQSPAVSDEPDPSPPEQAEPSAATDIVRHPLDPYSILVVSLNDLDPDAEATAALAGCHDAVVEELRRLVGLNVIAGERLKPFSGSTSPEFEVARQVGAGNVLILRTMNRQPQCRTELFDVQTGAGKAAYFTLGDRPRESWSGVGASVARTVQQAILKDTDALQAEARATVLNTALGDRERVNAMGRLRQSLAATFDEAVLTAAVQIGMTSRDADARATAWNALRGVTDPYIVQPLLYAVANDAAEDVRLAAALTLAPFIDQAVVRDALTRAAAEVPSETPKASRRTFTVRSAARLALRAGLEPADAVRGTVLDEALTPQERLVLLRPDGVRSLRLDQLGDEAVRAVFALGSSADDAEVRSRAWGLLGDVSERDFVPALLEDLERHPVEAVRAGAATGLRQHRDDPEVRAALDRALADPSLLVQRAARNALDGVRVVLL